MPGIAEKVAAAARGPREHLTPELHWQVDSRDVTIRWGRSDDECLIIPKNDFAEALVALGFVSVAVVRSRTPGGA